MNLDQAKTRFHWEAAVGIAKSTLFLAISEDDVQRHGFISATISAYYSLFHLSISLMWLFAEQLPPTLNKVLSDLQDDGAELPSPNITHKSVEKFLGCGQLKLSNRKILLKTFMRAQELREFCNYGPRVSYLDQNPTLGPCRFKPRDVIALVSEIRPLIIQTIKIAAPETGLEGLLAQVVISNSIKLMKDPNLHFLNWTSENVNNTALELLEKINAEINV